MRETVEHLHLPQKLDGFCELLTRSCHKCCRRFAQLAPRSHKAVCRSGLDALAIWDIRSLPAWRHPAIRGKLLATPWRTAGDSLVNCWWCLDRLLRDCLANCWQVLSTLRESLMPLRMGTASVAHHMPPKPTPVDTCVLPFSWVPVRAKKKPVCPKRVGLMPPFPQSQC